MQSAQKIGNLIQTDNTNENDLHLYIELAYYGLCTQTGNVSCGNQQLETGAGALRHLGAGVFGYETRSAEFRSRTWPMSRFHANKQLASNSVRSVERDVIHSYFGAADIRFQPADFVQLCEMLLSALGQTPPAVIRAAWPVTTVTGQSN